MSIKNGTWYMYKCYQGLTCENLIQQVLYKYTHSQLSKTPCPSIFVKIFAIFSGYKHPTFNAEF